MSTPDSGRRDCQECGAAVGPTANFCSQCGSRVEADRFCSQCGEALGPDEAFCAHCGDARSSADRQQGEGREAFRRRVRDHVEAGWEIKDDRGNRVTLVDRSIGPIPVHILLVFITSGVGNLIYGWYHYSKLADYRYLSVGDGRQPRSPEASAPADSTTTEVDRTVDIASYIIGGITALVGLFFLLATASGGGFGAPLFAALGLVFAIGGLGILPPVKRRLARRHGLTKFGRLKTVDHRVVYPREGHDEPCIVCGTRGRSGLLRRRRDETVLAGVPIRTHEEDHNFYCERCATAELDGGGTGVGGVDEAELSATETN